MSAFSKCALLLFGIALASCTSTRETRTVGFEEIASPEVAEINADLRSGPLTMDVGIFVPRNLDPGFDDVTVELLLDGVRYAKEVFAQADVQIRLLWIKTETIDPAFLSLMESSAPSMPASRHVGMYTKYRRNPTKLSPQARSAFESMIEPHADNSRTLHLIVLQDVFMPYYAENEAGDYVFAVTPTSGLSFPGYMFGKEMPHRLRGAITLTNLNRGENSAKTIAHELGHKVLNVSHEYMDTPPGFEIVGQGGLMIYGSGTEIPSGRE
ncbi:MAG: hypothetical protein AAF368_19955, partial [Planctomycetota bacterium]